MIKLIVLDYNILLIVFGYGKRLIVIICNIILMFYCRIIDNFEIGFKWIDLINWCKFKSKKKMYVKIVLISWVYKFYFI